jgi:hypothetical protein
MSVTKIEMFDCEPVMYHDYYGNIRSVEHKLGGYVNNSNIPIEKRELLRYNQLPESPIFYGFTKWMDAHVANQIAVKKITKLLHQRKTIINSAAIDQISVIDAELEELYNDMGAYSFIKDSYRFVPSGEHEEIDEEYHIIYYMLEVTSNPNLKKCEYLFIPHSAYSHYPNRSLTYCLDTDPIPWILTIPKNKYPLLTEMGETIGSFDERSNDSEEHYYLKAKQHILKQLQISAKEQENASILENIAQAKALKQKALKLQEVKNKRLLDEAILLSEKYADELLNEIQQQKPKKKTGKKKVKSTKPVVKPITAKPVTTKPVTTKPVTTKPVTTKPAAAKPATDLAVKDNWVLVTNKSVAAKPIIRPVTTRPVTTRLVTTRPVTAKSVTTKPDTTKPVTTKLVTTKSVTSGPVTTKLVTTKSVTSGPVTTKLVTTKSVTSEPVTTKPVTTEPVTTEPVTNKPVTIKPVTIKPVTTKPVTTKPVTTKPVTTKPVTTKPVTTKPVTTRSVAAEKITDHSVATNLLANDDDEIVNPIIIDEKELKKMETIIAKQKTDIECLTKYNFSASNKELKRRLENCYKTRKLLNRTLMECVDEDEIFELSVKINRTFVESANIQTLLGTGITYYPEQFNSFYNLTFAFLNKLNNMYLFHAHASMFMPTNEEERLQRLFHASEQRIIDTKITRVYSIITEFNILTKN